MSVKIALAAPSEPFLEGIEARMTWEDLFNQGPQKSRVSNLYGITCQPNEEMWTSATEAVLAGSAALVIANYDPKSRTHMDLGPDNIRQIEIARALGKGIYVHSSFGVTPGPHLDGVVFVGKRVEMITERIGEK